MTMEAAPRLSPQRPRQYLVGSLTVCRYFNATLSRSQLEVAP
jgi:hypothetical protein